MSYHYWCFRLRKLKLFFLFFIFSNSFVCLYCLYKIYLNVQVLRERELAESLASSSEEYLRQAGDWNAPDSADTQHSPTRYQIAPLL